MAEDNLLMRGATCALGYACIQIAKALGCRVSATTHKIKKMELLKCDVDEIIFDDVRLLESKIKFTNILELVGARMLRSSLKIVQKGGIEMIKVGGIVMML